MEEKSCRRYIFSREDNFLFNSDNSAMKIFKLLSILEYQGGYVRLKIAIHPSKIIGVQMDKSG